MARTEHAIFTVLVMVTDSDGNFLVENRLDPGWPGICFPGGHVEPGESFTEAAIRETREETGLTLLNPRLCGVKQFPGEYGRYVVFLLKTDQFMGEIHSSEEGAVEWVDRSRLTQINTVDDFQELLDVMEQESYNELLYERDGDNWTVILK